MSATIFWEPRGKLKPSFNVSAPSSFNEVMRKRFGSAPWEVSADDVSWLQGVRDSGSGCADWDEEARRDQDMAGALTTPESLTAEERHQLLTVKALRGSKALDKLLRIHDRLEAENRSPRVINMNQRVSVRLTEHGLRMLDEWEAELGLPERHRRINVTEGNLWRGELWALLQQFSERVTMVMNIPFVDNRVEVEPSPL